MLRKYLLFNLLFAFILFGCAAGKKYFQMGVELEKVGKYNDAIAYLEEALEKEPNNEKYLDFMKDLKSKLIKRYISQANSILEQKQDVTINEVRELEEILKKCESVDRHAAQVISFREKVSKLREDLLNKVKQNYSLAKDAIEDNQWDKAYFYLQKIQGLFPNYEDTPHLMDRCKKDGTKYYLSKAKELFYKEDFKQAIFFLRKGLILDPLNKDARQLLEQAKTNDTKEYFFESAKRAVSSSNWDLAVKQYKRALEYDPNDSKLQSLLEMAKSQASDYYLNECKVNIKSGLFARAVDSFLLAKKYISIDKQYKLDPVKKLLASKLKSTGDYFISKGKYGIAWYWYSKIKKIYPEYPKIFFLIQDMEDKVKHNVQKSIAVFDFKSPSSNPDAGIIVANNLITFLFENASRDIKILERENLKSILEEMKLGQIGVVSAQTAKEMGRIYGIDVAIMGSVLLYKVDSSISKSSKTIRYKIGTQIEDNIEYLNWKARHPDPNEEELKEAPPAKLAVPKYAEKDIEITKVRKVGFVQLSFRIVDITTGENLDVKTIKRQKIVEDETCPALPDAHIKYDPLEVPTDTELLQKITNDVVAELGLEVLRPLRNLEKKYYVAGENLLRRRQKIDAAEMFIYAIFDERLKGIIDSPVTKNAVKKVEDIFRSYNVKL